MALIPMDFYQWLNSLGYIIVALFAFLESFPFVGFLVPGQVIIILAGFFSKQGILSLYYVILISFVSVMLSNITGYCLGRYSKNRFEKHLVKLFYKREYYEKTKHLFQKHPGKVLIIGKIHPLTRTLTSYIAGSVNLPFKIFLIYISIGSLIWAVLFPVFGYVLGEFYNFTSIYFGVAISLFVILSFVLIIFLVKKYFNSLSEKAMSK